jgi:hypothetical protein
VQFPQPQPFGKERRKASSGKSSQMYLGEQRKSTASSGSSTPTTPGSSALQRDFSRDLIGSSSPPNGRIEGVIFDEAVAESMSTVPVGRPKSVTLSLSGNISARVFLLSNLSDSFFKENCLLKRTKRYFVIFKSTSLDC